MLTNRQKELIRNFIADYGKCQVRDVKFAAELRQIELRTKKHDHLAVCWDELGNAFVLTRRGERKQLIGGKEIAG